HLVWIDVVEAVEIDRDEVASQLGQMPAREAVNAAPPAKEPARDLGAPFVCAQALLARNQREGARLHHADGGGDLGADAAVAPARARAHVDSDLEADGAAVAASHVLARVGLGRRFLVLVPLFHVGSPSSRAARAPRPRELRERSRGLHRRGDIWQDGLIAY